MSATETWKVIDGASALRHLGWMEVHTDRQDDPERARKFVKINGGVHDYLYQPVDATDYAIAYRVGLCDGIQMTIATLA